MATAGNITAVLSLNSSGFQEGLGKSLEAVDKFKATFSKSITPMAQDLARLKSSLQMLQGSLDGVTQIINKFNVSAKGLSQFSTYASSVNKLANALKILSSDTINAEKSMNIINNMFKYFRETLNGTKVQITGVATSLKGLSSSESEANSKLNQLKQGFTSTYASAEKLNAHLSALRERFISMDNSTSVGRSNLALYHQNLKALALGVEQFNAIETKHTSVEQQVASATNQATSSIQRQSSAMNTGSSSANRMTTATRGLGKAMSSLRMMGTMVGSMIAYNFVHNLAMATTETINAKSEMEGYFQMLHYSKDQVNDFNKSLEETVQLFPRLNKYALGETISSIGVEFELTTEEMKKAMPVVSMITSEYLRAGRNVNEASLAVKDILQGEFQRLSLVIRMM